MLRKQISALPPWLPTAATLALILWLTLSPDPLGDESPTFFPGADKVVHALMFGFLAVMAMLDLQRSRNWRPLPPRAVVAAALASALAGIAVEFAQLFMDMGRGFEVADMAADAAGASACAGMWLLLQKRWSRP
ncbi:MAG: VanZ family protein [Bacteroidales bacterium]|nr:VanZ family protein [Bacteroidales bacterium]